VCAIFPSRPGTCVQLLNPLTSPLTHRAARFDEAGRDGRPQLAWARIPGHRVPFGLPSAEFWNMMMSMSPRLVSFVVAAERSAVGHNHHRLARHRFPIIALAIARQNLNSELLPIAAMLVVIGDDDHLLFRPLVAWADKFRSTARTAETTPNAWVLA